MFSDLDVLPSDPIGGLHCVEWMEFYMVTYNIEGGKKDLVAWPDGRSYLEQDMLLINVFRIIGDELAKMRKKANG